jgi:Raf kinase inhibitor-like YbhB/YbcL family protein
MKSFIATAAVLALSTSVVLAQQNAPARPPAPQPQLKLSTAAFPDGGRIKVPYACQDSQNFSRHSLPLEWTGAPEGTASFAIVMHDTDVHPRKAAEDVLHWMIWNIPGTATKLAENLGAAPELADGSRQSKNITNQVGYMGPCAPVGKPHHYVLELYALDQKLDTAPEGTRADVLKAMDGHILASGVYVGLFNQ